MRGRYKGKLDANADEFIDYAVDGAARMQALINDLLSLSRISTRGQEFKLIDCATVLNNAIANLKIAIEESGGKGATFYFTIPDKVGNQS